MEDISGIESSNAGSDFHLDQKSLFLEFKKFREGGNRLTSFLKCTLLNQDINLICKLRTFNKY